MMEVVVLKKIILSPVALVRVGDNHYIVNDPQYYGTTLQELQRYVDEVVYDTHQTLQGSGLEGSGKEYDVVHIMAVLFSKYSRVC